MAFIQSLPEEDPPKVRSSRWRIFVPYTLPGLHDQTLQWLDGVGSDIDMVRIRPDDVGGYARAFAKRWNLGTQLIVIEQDILPGPEMLSGLLWCQRPWCAHEYYCGTENLAYGLGFCRFSAGIQAARPSLGEQAGKDHRGRPGTRHWIGLNERVISLMQHFGHDVHIHQPQVTHLHEYPVALVDHG